MSQYFVQIDRLNAWFKQSFLKLNVGKTKELVCDNRRERQTPKEIVIDDEEVEIVSLFKYLGTGIDSKLCFQENTDIIYKKAQQRLFLLRKLKSFNVSQCILERVYRSLIESVISFNIVTWYGNLTMRNKLKLSSVINTASKVIGKQQIPLSVLYHNSMNRKTRSILNDSTHPLYRLFQKLPSGRRYRVPRARRNVYKHSFIPSAISILNNTE